MIVFYIISAVLMAIFAYCAIRAYTVGYWEELAKTYVKWYQDLCPTGEPITEQDIVITLWLIICPWKWHVRHAFPPDKWELLSRKLAIM